MMNDDLAGIDVDSLDHIARRMADIHRRLDLGQADEKVRQVEDGVIASLDKLIKKLQEQAEQGQQQAAASGQWQPRSPAQDSYRLLGKGPGKVEKKDLGSASDWGNLPPKQREEAMQQIGRQFPSHYHDVIEQYFKKLAKERDSR
jgi:hypothetical protein